MERLSLVWNFLPQVRISLGIRRTELSGRMIHRHRGEGQRRQGACGEAKGMSQFRQQQCFLAGRFELRFRSQWISA